VLHRHGRTANMREKMRAIEAANAFKEGTGMKVADGAGQGGLDKKA
jgi:hypothetical protein